MSLYFFYVSINILIEYTFINARGKENIRRQYIHIFGLIFKTVSSWVRKRVSFVHYDLYKKGWEVIGKILAKGFIDTECFQKRLVNHL